MRQALRVTCALSCPEGAARQEDSAPRPTADRMRTALTLLLLCLLAQVSPGSGPGPWALAAPGTPPPPTARPEPAEEEEGALLRASGQQLSRDTSALGFGLLRKLSLRQDGNVLFSPLGLAAALATLMLGSPPARNRTRAWHRPPLFGPLRERLSRTRELGLTQGSVTFVHEDFEARETFLNASRRLFAAECVSVDFRSASRAAALVNRHVARRTHGRIPRLVRRVDPDTELLLTDYVLFEGAAHGRPSPPRVAGGRATRTARERIPGLHRAGPVSLSCPARAPPRAPGRPRGVPSTCAPSPHPDGANLQGR